MTTSDTPNPHPNDRPHNNHTGRVEPSQNAAHRAAPAPRRKADNPRRSDQQIADAVVWTFARAKIVAEPSGAASIAAVLGGAIDSAGPIVAIVSGGNLGVDALARFAQTPC